MEVQQYGTKQPMDSWRNQRGWGSPGGWWERIHLLGFPGVSETKTPHAMQESSSQCRRHRFDPWSGKITHAAEQLGLCRKTIEPVLWSLRATSMRPWAATTEACAPWSIQHVGNSLTRCPESALAEVLKEWPCFSCGVSNGLSGEPEGKRGSIF